MAPPKRLRLGITGHRVLAEADKLEAGIETALRGIERAYPGAAFTALSALAEGADRLVAELVLARPGGTLVAVLPLPEAAYIEDFATEHSRAQFRDLLRRAERRVELGADGTGGAGGAGGTGGAGSDRAQAYARAGEYILERCDVLVAVWDGRPVQGHGGTGAVVAAARERGKPLAWVHAGNRAPGTMEPTSLGDEQGAVSFERLRRPEREPPV